MRRFLVIPLLFCAAPALADRAGADACAQNLSPPAQQVYQATAADIKKDSDLREVIRSHTRQLVMDGKLDRDIARAAAQAAGGCLKAINE